MHDNEPLRAIKAVRDWLSNATLRSLVMPGGSTIARRYELFRTDLPAMCDRLQISVDELTFNDYVVQVKSGSN